MKLVLALFLFLVPMVSFAALTKGQLKAVIAASDAKGQPDDAAVSVNGAGVNGTVHVELGKFRKMPDGTEVVETPPSLDIVQ